MPVPTLTPPLHLPQLLLPCNLLLMYPLQDPLPTPPSLSSQRLVCPSPQTLDGLLLPNHQTLLQLPRLASTLVKLVLELEQTHQGLASTLVLQQG